MIFCHFRTGADSCTGAGDTLQQAFDDCKSIAEDLAVDGEPTVTGCDFFLVGSPSKVILKKKKKIQTTYVETLEWK